MLVDPSYCWKGMAHVMGQDRWNSFRSPLRSDQGTVLEASVYPEESLAQSLQGCVGEDEIREFDTLGMATRFQDHFHPQM